MSTKTPPAHGHGEPFGSIIGVAPGGVPVYSSDYASADEAQLPDRHAYRSYVDGVYVGHKWQCVEFARRWLYETRGWLFDEVGMAYEIFDLTSIRDVRNDTRLPLRSFRNGARRPPEPGCLLVWDEGPGFERTGHVAIVVEVLPDRIRFAEQNYENHRWPDGRAWSREIHATRGPAGEFWLECSFADATIIGWVVQTEDGLDAEPIEEVDPRLFDLIPLEVEPDKRTDRAWLNLANPDEAAFVEFMEGHFLSELPSSRYLYYAMSETALDELERASNQLHLLFMHATDYVLRDDALLARFRIPRVLWPKIHQSWNNRRNEMITGRFDFAVTPRGVRVYEYNCDSAACYMECGKVQGRWAEHFDCEIGDDAGAVLHDRLRDAWRARGIDGLLHIMQDEDPEETYHALFMQEAMERAGIASRIIRGTDGLAWRGDGTIVDGEGDPIRWVWKSWAWETALDQLREQCGEDERNPERHPGEPHDGPVRLVDVLLRGEVMVFEPLWTLIPSNKAILPVLWSLFPNHRNLLATSFDLNDELRAGGYVRKPIVGRCGDNISIFDDEQALVEQTQGGFGERDQIYQELFPLPRAGGHYAQVSTFSVAGAYAAAGVRVDPSMVITGKSENVALRVVEDDHFLELLD